MIALLVPLNSTALSLECKQVMEPLSSVVLATYVVLDLTLSEVLLSAQSIITARTETKHLALLVLLVSRESPKLLNASTVLLERFAQTTL